MPRFLTLFEYSADGTKGFLKDGAAAREAAIRKAFESVGGRMEAMYWAGSGDYSGIVIGETPDTASSAALAAFVSASGAIAKNQLVELLASSEIDQALANPMSYRPPGAAK